MLAGLILTGLSLRRVEAPLWAAIRAGEPALRLDAGTTAEEPGVVLGVLGGFRTAVADIIWLRAQVFVEARNLPAAESLLGLVTAIDPRPLYFWLNGARIMAYDMPEWRIWEAGGYSEVSAGVQERIRQEQAQRALARLDEAMRFHPSSAALWIERANLQLNRLSDLPGAATSYRRASEQPDAPFFAARLHAGLLRRLGRRAEAHAWLTQLHPQLPASDESAGAALVLARIRELERELGVPAGQGYCQRAGRGFDPD